MTRTSPSSVTVGDDRPHHPHPRHQHHISSGRDALTHHHCDTTKFEFGLDPDGTLVLMDEVLTPGICRATGPAESSTLGATRPATTSSLCAIIEQAMNGVLGQDRPAPRPLQEVIAKRRPVPRERPTPPDTH